MPVTGNKLAYGREYVENVKHVQPSNELFARENKIDRQKPPRIPERSVSFGEHGGFVAEVAKGKSDRLVLENSIAEWHEFPRRPDELDPRALTCGMLLSDS
jgi:hypothetical protein